MQMGIYARGLEALLLWRQVSHDPPEPTSCVIHCDGSSSSTPCDLTVVLPPSLSTTLSGGSPCHAYFIDDPDMQPLYSATG